MIKKGLLDKHSKPNENTPIDWKKSYIDYGVSVEPKIKKEALTPVADKSTETKRKREQKSSRYQFYKTYFLSSQMGSGELNC
jgi:hypothetical protein